MQNDKHIIDDFDIIKAIMLNHDINILKIYLNIYNKFHVSSR